jgi:hypothetical protein
MDAAKSKSGGTPRCPPENETIEGKPGLCKEKIFSMTKALIFFPIPSISSL